MVCLNYLITFWRIILTSRLPMIADPPPKTNCVTSPAGFGAVGPFSILDQVIMLLRYCQAKNEKAGIVTFVHFLVPLTFSGLTFVEHVGVPTSLGQELEIFWTRNRGNCR